MQQYFVNTLAMPGELIPMTKEQTHHIRRVMRMQQGEMCIRDRLRSLAQKGEMKQR